MMMLQQPRQDVAMLRRVFRLEQLKAEVSGEQKMTKRN